MSTIHAYALHWEKREINAKAHASHGRISIILPGRGRHTVIEGLPSAIGDGPNGIASGAPFVPGLAGVWDYNPETGEASPVIPYL